MAGKLPIVWTPRAKNDLARIHSFILKKWSYREAENLLGFIEDFEGLISNYPQAFRRSVAYSGLRLGLVHRNTTAVYVERETYIDSHII